MAIIKEFKIDVLPAKGEGLGWENVIVHFLETVQEDKIMGDDVAVLRVGSTSAGEAQNCIIQNYYETYPR